MAQVEALKGLQSASAEAPGLGIWAPRLEALTPLKALKLLKPEPYKIPKLLENGRPILLAQETRFRDLRGG